MTGGNSQARLFKLLATAVLAAVLVACGGGAEDVSTGSESASGAYAPAAADLPGGVAPPAGKSILNEWESYEDPDAAQPAATAADPIEALVGKGARLNRESLEAAQRKAAAAPPVRKAAYGGLVPVYRFYNASTAAHFYTRSETERDDVILNLPNFQYEGPAFEVSPTPQEGLSPVYRFFNTATGVHFYTISEEERALIVSSLPQYIAEGVAYYASTVAGTGLTPMYRFYRQDRGLHFYTAHYTERDNVISMSCAYRYEGTGYYVFDANAVANPPAATPNAVVLVVGDSLARGYGVSLGGTVYNFVSRGQVWTERLATEIKTRTNRTCNKVVNVSVGGMRTVEGASGIQGWLDAYAPTHVILAQGTNDALQDLGVGSMSSRLTNMAQASKLIGAHVYVMEFPFYPAGYRNNRQDMTTMYQGVATNNLVAYLNGAGNVPANPTYYHPDSVHLKDAAQPRVLETVWAALQPSL